VSTCAITWDGTTLVSGSLNGRLLLWNLKSQKIIARGQTENSEFILGCAVAPGDSPIVTSSLEKLVHVWKPFFSNDV